MRVLTGFSARLVAHAKRHMSARLKPEIRGGDPFWEYGPCPSECPQHGQDIRGLVVEWGQDGSWRIVWGTVPDSCPTHRNDPRGFCREVLGVHPLRHQLAILLSVRDHKSTAVASCHGAGKSHTAALVALWYFCTRRPALVFTTAPTNDQVEGILWAYLATMHAAAKQKLPGKVQTKKLKTGDRLWEAMGRAARDGNAAQGKHSANLLIIYDEASGVRDDIRTSLEGALGDVNARELAIGNPTGAKGFFREAWERTSEFWVRFNISALDLINVRRKRRIIPGLQGWEWVETIRKRFKEGSPYWICRVLGRFFNFGSEKTIPREYVKAAQARWETTPEDGPRWLLADVAASVDKDSTGICIRAGRRLWPVDRYQEPDTMVNARKILALAKANGCVQIRVDATGPGKGVGDKLQEMSDQGLADGIQIIRVVWGASSTEPEYFDRLMDEMWFRCREAFDPGTPEIPNEKAVAIPPSDDGGLADELAEQLSLRGYTMNRFGKIKVESKPELRARGAGSPDVADAAVQGFFAVQEVTWFSV